MTIRSLLPGLVALVTLGCSRSDTRVADSARVDSAPGGARAVTPPASGIATNASEPVGQLTCIVTDSSIGPVRIGMTLADARAALPARATFTRGYDGEGVASVDIVVGADSMMSVVADGDEDEGIDWSKRIAFMQTFSTNCRTAEGVHPGALVRDVERILGRTTKVIMSEIESRQFITFERQPEGITFRLDYTGIFDEGSRETTRVEPEGKIFSISIAGR